MAIMRPVSLDEAVEVTEQEENMTGRFRAERDRLRLGLATASLKFEHVGSTAVPGLAGRPVVDLMLGASPPVWATLEELRARVVTLGYEDLGQAGVPGRILFRRRTPLRAFNVSLVEENGPLWRDGLALRDHLRAHPDAAAAYAASKRAAIAGGARTVPAYAEAKAPALAALLETARAGR